MSIGAAYQIGRETGRLRRRTAPVAQQVRTQIFELRFSNHANALASRTIIKRIVPACGFFRARTIRCRIGALGASNGAIKWNSSLSGGPSHLKPVDDQWQTICRLSPNHPAEVFKDVSPDCSHNIRRLNDGTGQALLRRSNTVLLLRQDAGEPTLCRKHSARTKVVLQARIREQSP
jgi:hypothetical protein